MTTDGDMSSAAGLEKAIEAIRAFDVGHVAVRFALPCTWGTGARDCNIARPQSYIDVSVKHCDAFEKFSPNVIIISNEVLAVGGDAMFEWTAGTVSWNMDITNMFMTQFGFRDFQTNGCMLGLGDPNAPGLLLRKAWIIATSSLFIYDALSAKVCPGDAHKGMRGVARQQRGIFRKMPAAYGRVDAQGVG